MAFEFDPKKSASNKAKHGIDFVEAQALWDGPIVAGLAIMVEDEPRWAVIGKIKGKFWTAIITKRGENIRIISARRAREDEVEFYEQG